jgi:DDE domain
VRWYLRFGLSYRDVEELLAERGIEVDHVTVHRWVQRFAPLLVDAARFGRHQVGDRWHVDETYVKVACRWVYLYRAVDQNGQVIDVYASSRRDREAARRFFQRARMSTGVAPGAALDGTGESRATHGRQPPPAQCDPGMVGRDRMQPRTEPGRGAATAAGPARSGRCTSSGAPESSCAARTATTPSRKSSKTARACG